MEANNKSREYAKELATTMGWLQEGRGNFYRNAKGDLLNITLTTKGKIESRQFRLDCKYLISLGTRTNTLSVFNKKDLIIGNVTRVGADGMHYYQAKAL